MDTRLVVALVLLALAAVPLVATAQPGTNSTVTDDRPAREPIDDLTAIESAVVANGEMILVIHSEVPQRVVLTDAGAVWTGGRVRRYPRTLQAGSNRVSVPVTEVSGRVAVTIATGDVLYAKTVRTDAPLVGPPFDRRDVQNAALAGLVSGIGVTAAIAYRRVRGADHAPERIL